ncbi:CheR family methyltransferase [Azotobacter salinestris]|uniref:CheR family methyltransferase n=1 Tax=Azotobacter salinestris TaxID=69964 RepID=UPI0012668DC1|nr:CheR family methyltransferase [Azotobacter salinestris]
MQPRGAWAMKTSAEMSAAEFRDWQRLLEQRCGLVLDEQRKRFLQIGLSARMGELGLSDYASYYRRVIDGPRGALEWLQLLDRLTVQETCFFRHAPSFALLERYLRARLAADGMQRPWAFWSVGCSTGEEPYSLAITAMEVLGGEVAAPAERFGVTATDISRSALEKLGRGLYPALKLERLDATLRERYFTAHPDGRYRILPGLASRVCGTRLNVLDLAKAPMSGMDVIFCQNLLIYFRRWRRREILNRLAERLAPGGLLVIGVGEVVGWQHPDLVPVADPLVLAFTRRG